MYLTKLITGKRNIGLNNNAFFYLQSMDIVEMNAVIPDTAAVN